MSATQKSKNPPARASLRKELGLRIVQARKRRGWSQAKLARRLEVSREQLGNWERAVYAPSLEALVKLAEVLEVTLEELVRGGGEPVPRIPPALRSEALMYLNGFLRTIKPVLGAPKGKKKEE